MEEQKTSLLEKNYIFLNIHRFEFNSMYNFDYSLFKPEFFITLLFFSI